MRKCPYNNETECGIDEYCNVCWVKTNYIDRVRKQDPVKEIEQGLWPRFIRELKRQIKK